MIGAVRLRNLFALGDLKSSSFADCATHLHVRCPIYNMLADCVAQLAGLRLLKTCGFVCRNGALPETSVTAFSPEGGYVTYGVVAFCSCNSFSIVDTCVDQVVLCSPLTISLCAMAGKCLEKIFCFEACRFYTSSTL